MKKITPKAKQTQLLMEKAKLKKQFFERLKSICIKMTNEEVYTSFTKKQLEELYSLRWNTQKLVIGEGEHISKEIYSELQSFFELNLYHTLIALANPENSVTLKEFFEEGISLIQYVTLLKEYDHPNVRFLKNAFSRYFIEEDILKEAIIKKNSMNLYLQVTVNDFKNGMYLIQQTFCYKEKNGRCTNRVEIKKVAIDEQSVTIHQQTRPVYRVFWPVTQDHFVYAGLKPSKLGLTNYPSDEPLPVYIQSHALHRLEERIGSMSGLMHLLVFGAFADPKITKESENKWLIDYELYNSKVGYLVITIVDDKIIVLTFLFLTCSDTPEGKRLAEITGLKKIDKKYLAIDKMQTFVSSEIKDNEKIKAIFIEAGCQSLFEFDTYDWYIKQPKLETSAELLAKYLSL